MCSPTHATLHGAATARAGPAMIETSQCSIAHARHGRALSFPFPPQQQATALCLCSKTSAAESLPGTGPATVHACASSLFVVSPLLCVGDPDPNALPPLPLRVGEMAPSLSLMVVLFLMAQAHPSAYASMERRTYIVHMDATKIAALDDSLGGANRWPQAVLDSLSSSRGEGEAQPAPQLLYVYDTALSGFAATLSAKQAESLQQLDGVLTAYPDELIHLHTTHSPDFLGLNPGKGLWSSPNLASDIVVGVIDTGIWPEHVSFSDTGYSSVNLSRWRGACEAGRGFSASNCNRKLVGALAFWKGYEAGGGKINETSEYRSARDSQGHGTHTASTAAGNIVAGASLLGNAKGSAKGMRYTAELQPIRHAGTQVVPVRTY
ncbi:subtilisin-like protease-like [Musa troglodytarum]|uniref:Subtilisin-like protease-like n=1 Tax=Musa troglodytarum TaxID=320322 RepID=A0A9E7KTC6_9LILI|nr:subtilisin-like protease-like [Musa troglodytarum]